MRVLRTTSSLAFAVGCLTVAARADAQTNPVAQQLFQEGQRLLAAGMIHEACEKLSASYQLQAGLGALMNLAVCHERENKTATAWTEFTEAAARATHDGDQERAQFAHTHADTLAKTMKKAVIRLEAVLAGTTVKLDGKELPGAALDVPIPIDAGAHTIEVSAAEKKTYTSSFAITDEAITEVRVPPLADVDAPSVSTPPAPSSVPATIEAKPPTLTRELQSGGGGARTAGFIVGGVGLVSLATAGFFGVRALSLNSTAIDEKNRSTRRPATPPTRVKRRSITTPPCRASSWGSSPPVPAWPARPWGFI